MHKTLAYYENNAKELSKRYESAKMDNIQQRGGGLWFVAKQWIMNHLMPSEGRNNSVNARGYCDLGYMTWLILV